MSGLWQAAERLAAIVTFWSDRKVFDAEAVAACRHAIGAPGEAPPGPTQAPALQPASAPGGALPGAAAPSGPGAPAGHAPYPAQPGGMPYAGAVPYPGQFAPGPAPGAAGYPGGDGAWAPGGRAPGVAAQVRAVRTACGSAPPVCLLLCALYIYSWSSAPSVGS